MVLGRHRRDNGAMKLRPMLVTAWARTPDSDRYDELERDPARGFRDVSIVGVVSPSLR